ncbi:hypothetical protein KM043_013393 [Ampulex compressa]|nr:hypothetical protein KM043_013393 [Ampulex compressa]
MQCFDTIHSNFLIYIIFWTDDCRGLKRIFESPVSEINFNIKNYPSRVRQLSYRLISHSVYVGKSWKNRDFVINPTEYKPAFTSVDSFFLQRKLGHRQPPIRGHIRPVMSSSA